MAAGKYIVIEGNDGTGKSTQVELLAAYLKGQGHSVFVPQEPAGTSIADEIRKVIVNGDLPRDGITNVLLFTAARRSIWQMIEPKLAEGTWVVASRNYLSTLAYQGYGEGVDKDLIIQTTATYIGEGYVRPDYTIVLTLTDKTEREKRIAKRGVLEKLDTFESRDKAFQDTVNDAYLTIADRYGLPTIDAQQSIDDIQAKIRALLAI